MEEDAVLTGQGKWGELRQVLQGSSLHTPKSPCPAVLLTWRSSKPVMPELVALCTDCAAGAHSGSTGCKYQIIIYDHQHHADLSHCAPRSHLSQSQIRTKSPSLEHR